MELTNELYYIKNSWNGREIEALPHKLNGWMWEPTRFIPDNYDGDFIFDSDTLPDGLRRSWQDRTGQVFGYAGRWLLIVDYMIFSDQYICAPLSIGARFRLFRLRLKYKVYYPAYSKVFRWLRKSRVIVIIDDDFFMIAPADWSKAQWFGRWTIGRKR